MEPEALAKPELLDQSELMRTFSRHGKVQASLALFIWLNENVRKNGYLVRDGSNKNGQ